MVAAYIVGLVTSFYVRNLEDRPALWELADLRQRIGRSPRPAGTTAAAPASTRAAVAGAAADRADAAPAGPADPAPPENR